MTLKWLPAFTGTDEISPALPLHDPQIGWITATYCDRSKRDIDISTALRDAHLISHVELGTTVGTHALYRILLSIAYDGLKAHLVNKETWRASSLDLLRYNSGFDPEWVGSYFTRWEDRFYLVHPRFPFLQDPSLAATYGFGKTRLQDMSLESRLAYERQTTSISQVYPLSPSTNMREGQKTIWGLPQDEVYARELPLSKRVEILIDALLYQRYAHPATKKSSRSFIDNLEASDTHPAAHAFRTAVAFLPEAGSLFKSLVIAMEFEYAEELIDDIPEWEWDINEQTGFLGVNGLDAPWTDRLKSVTAPRSSINLSQMAMLYVPEYIEGEEFSEQNLGEVRQLRRVAFNFKHLTVTNSAGKTEKMPFPVTWNPYVAVRDNGRAMKQTEAISSKTALSNSTLFRVALLPEVPEISAPGALQRIRQAEVHEIVYAQSSLRILVHAGDPSQEKNYSFFTIATKDIAGLIDKPEMLGRIDDWLELGGKLAWAVKKNLKNLSSDDASATKIDVAGPETIFWTAYYEKFMSSLQGDYVAPPGELKHELIELVSDIYRSHSQQFVLSTPLRAAKFENSLRSYAYSLLKNQEKEQG